VALPTTLAVAYVVSWRYRAAVRHLMRLAPPPREADLAGAGGENVPLPSRSPAGLLRRPRDRELSLAFAGVSLLIGITSAVLLLLVEGQTLLPMRLLITSLVMATPGLVLQAQILRWPVLRQAVVLVVWSLLLLLLVGLASGGLGLDQLGLVLVPLLLSLVVLGLLFGIPRLRAIAPYLFPPIFLVFLLGQFGLEILQWLVAGGPEGALGAFVRSAGAVTTVLLAVALPVAIALLPAHAITASIGRIYRAKAFSDLSYLFGTGWFLMLLLLLIPGWNSKVAAGAPWDGRPLLPLLAWLWIPLFFHGFSRFARRSPPADPPALLMLRVFRRKGPVGWLFDHVVQRWRTVGPVLLISAADLASRTIEPDDLVLFLEGRLRQRYILEPEDLRRQLAAIDQTPDHDGRYRVTDFCCYASSWKQTLDALLLRASTVLMDLRGFTAENKGCLYELGRISQASHLTSVVLLADGHTDRAAADHALQSHRGSPAVQWVEAANRRLGSVDRLLDQLLAPGG